MFLVNAPLKIIVVSWGEKRGWLTWLKDDIIINGSELYAHKGLPTCGIIAFPKTLHHESRYKTINIIISR